MNLPRILDVIEALLVASEHPDIAEVKRYGPSAENSKTTSIAGVRVKYQSSATASLWGAVWPTVIPIPLPDNMPPPGRAARLPIFAVQLLEITRPQLFRSWQLVHLPGIGLEGARSPGGVSLVCDDGTTMLLRSTATGITMGQEGDYDLG